MDSENYCSSLIGWTFYCGVEIKGRKLNYLQHQLELFFRKMYPKHVYWGYLWDFSQVCTKMVFLKETCFMRSVDSLYIFLFFFFFDDYCLECGHQILLALYIYLFLFLIRNVLLPHLPTYLYLAIKCWEQWQLFSWTPSMYKCVNNRLTCKYLDNHSANQRHWCHRF